MRGSWASFFLSLDSEPLIEEAEQITESKPVQVDLTPEQILKNAGFKIKSRILTDFGTQFELFKKIDPETLKQLGETRMKGNLIFVLI